MTLEGLERLDAWRRAREFALEIYRVVIPLMPVKEKYGLTSQLRRAAISVPANIAEGYGRYYYLSNVQFCYNARGSLEEIISHLTLAHDLGYMDDDIFLKIITKANNLTKLINGYISFLKREKAGEKDTVLVKDEQRIYVTGNQDPEAQDYDDSRLSIHDSR